MMVYRCNICSGRVLRHSRILICSFCYSRVHLYCLPNQIAVSDSIYTHRLESVWFCTLCIQNELPFNHTNCDEEFRIAVRSFFCDMNSYDISLLNSLVFNPFELQENLDDNLHNVCDDANPDLNYFNEYNCFNNTQPCEYYLENSFNKMCSDNANSSGNFAIIHTNIRSIPKNLSTFENYLSTLDIRFTVIGITETWLNANNSDFFYLNGYTGEHAYRQNRSGGGVSIFVRSETDYTLRSDLNTFSNCMESIFIELPKDYVKSEKNIIIGVIYRPPGTEIDSFITELNICLDKIGLENKLVYLTGDFNINLINYESHQPTSMFLDTLYSFSLFPLINKPTRITSSSATLIDNIFSNDIFGKKLINGILFNNISDHCPVFTINMSLSTNDSETIYKYRCFSNANKSKFATKINETEWEDVMTSNDCNTAFTLFHRKFLELFNTAFPLKTSFSKYHTRIPWLTEGLKNSIKLKNKLYLKSLRTPSNRNITNYKIFKNTLSRLMRRREKEYYHDKLAACANDIKKSWKIMKEIIHKGKRRKTCSKFNINDVVIDDNQVIASKFNDYFVNIGSSLANKIPTSNLKPSDFIQVSNDQSMFVSDTNVNEVLRIISGLKHTSPGWDGINSGCIKSNSNSLAVPLTHIINLSLNQGMFPTSMKIAKVIPLFKNDDCTKINNYRPVSVLPVLSKVFEKIMYRRILDFINKNNILYQFQFGFREKYNTSFALLTLIDKISSAIDKGEYVIGLFLDLSKAFDTINHRILFDKLYKYGVRGIALDWVKDYLSNRKQFVHFNGISSNQSDITCGVPQGSILGPLLFLLYVNDLPNVSDILFPLLFADDTNLFLSGNDLNNMINVINGEVRKIVSWLNCNKLSLNIKKNPFCYFHLQR